MKKVLLFILIIVLLGGAIYFSWNKNKAGVGISANTLGGVKSVTNTATTPDYGEEDLIKESNGSLLPVVKGCTDERACNYDETAVDGGDCTYAVYDVLIASPKSKACKLSTTDTNLEKPSSFEPVRPLRPQKNLTCQKTSDQKIGPYTSKNVHNVHIHSWTVTSNNEVINNSNIYIGSFSFVTIEAAKEYQGKNACKSLKMTLGM